MPEIKKLPIQTTCQIAAGEVVDRPASLVKELIENSLDAGSDEITVIIGKGGSERISVVDNGKGIEKLDLELALTRHATSKISSVSDLNTVTSFGFRGEALASAASISRLTLTSKHKLSEYAWEISSTETGELTKPKEARHHFGTSIDIYDLFYNVPARKLFLKHERTEFSHIEEVFNAFVIIRPDVKFKLIHNNKVVKDLKEITSFDKSINRLQSLFSSSFTNGITYMNFKLGNAWLVHPSFSRAKGDYQWIFVNNRLVKDHGLASVIKKAYQDVLMVGRFPAFIISLTIDPSLIDINIHPSKKEIKFAEKEQIYKQVFYAFSEKLKEITSFKKEPEIRLPEFTEAPKQPPKPFFNSVPNKQFSMQDTTSVTPNLNPVLEIKQEPTLGFAIAQVKGVYIISETKEGIIIVDMHAAHERIVYEQLKSQYTNFGVVKQKLLTPIEIKISLLQKNIIAEKMPLIRKFGFELDLISEKQIKLTEIPALLNKNNPEKIFEEFINELMDGEPTMSVEEQVNNILATIGCHSAIRANRMLSISEMNALLRQMESTDFAQACNHGRPTYKKFSMKDLDAIFFRGQ